MKHSAVQKQPRSQSPDWASSGYLTSGSQSPRAVQSRETDSFLSDDAALDYLRNRPDEFEPSALAMNTALDQVPVPQQAAVANKARPEASPHPKLGLESALGLKDPAAKLSKKVMRLYRGTPWYRWQLSSSKPLSLRRTAHAFFEGRADRGQMLLDGRFILEGERVDLSTETWFPDDVPPAWLQGLHSFDWLSDLRATRNPEASRAARHMVSSWLTHNKTWEEQTWSAPVTARRIIAWLSHFDFICKDAPATFVRRLIQEVAVQANHLLLCYNELEPSYDRFRVEHALVLAGNCLPDGNTLASDMVARIEGSLDALVRSDGGNQYRSPAMQLILMNELRDLIDFHRASRIQVPSFMDSTLERMAPFMRMMIYNDGSIAHMNRSIELPDKLMSAFAERCLMGVKPLEGAYATGFQRLSARRITLLADCGTVPPAGFDTWSHAGTLSFELTVGTQKMFCNVGSHERLSQWGEVQRTTAAHSTMVLQDTNSSEIKPDGTLGRQPVSVFSKTEESDDFVGLVMHHDGYRGLGKSKHMRSLRLSRDGDYLEGEDVVMGSAEVPAAIRFHLHPSVKATLDRESGRVLVKLPKGRPWTFLVDGATIGIEQSVYLSGENAVPSQQIVLHLPDTRTADMRHNPFERRVFWSIEQG